MKSKLPIPLSNERSHRLDLCTWPEVEEYLQICKGIIVPIGSTEQHGPTGCIGTDALTAKAVALELGKLSGVLVAPTISYGMAEHHLGFPGTMSLKPSTLIAVVHDLVISLAGHGFERIFFVNGHGGNIASTKAAFAEAYKTVLNNSNFSCSSKLRCRLSSWFMDSAVFQKSKELYGDKEGQHATPSEISLTLHLEPILLRKQRPLQEPASSGPIFGQQDFRKRYPDGRMGSDPFLAKPEHGKILLDLATSSLLEDLSQFLDLL
tara:strand:+ start:860 stop:1651 length:792 start_codon:yes stop_codon:yes gene_type:complete